MNVRTYTKRIRENDYIAEVEVELIEEEGPGTPYLSLDDVNKLESIRDALRAGDLESIGSKARVFKLTPVTSGT